VRTGASNACGIAALAEGFIEHDGSGGGDVEGAYATGHGDAEKVVAGAADEVVETGAFSAEDQDAVAGEVELVVIGGAALVEADDPEILFLEVFEGADEVDDAGDAEVFGGSGAGFDCYRTDGGGTALGEDDAVDACPVGYAEERAEILRVFDSVEGEEQAAAGGVGRVGSEEVLNGEEFLGANHGDDALVRGGLGEEGELLTGILAHADAGLAKCRDQPFEAEIFAFAGDDDVVKAAATSLESFFHRVHAVENFHRDSVEDRGSGVSRAARVLAPAAQGKRS
jgi:hypothetical protein